MKKILLACGLALSPVLAFADTANLNGVATDFSNTAGTVKGLVNILIGVMTAIAIMMFVVYVIRYVIADGPDDKGKAARGIMWCVIGLACIFLLYGLISFLGSTFGVSNNESVSLPQVGGGSSPNGSICNYGYECASGQCFNYTCV